MSETVRVDDYAYYWAQLAHQEGQGPKPEVERGHPQCGYYRERDGSAFAIWRDPKSWKLVAQKSNWNFLFTKEDEIDDHFGFVCRRAVRYADYLAKVAPGGKWPDETREPKQEELAQAAAEIAAERPQPAPHQEAAENPRAVAGDNNPPDGLTPERALLVRIIAKAKIAEEWKRSLPGGKPASKSEADLAANYASDFRSLEAEGDAAHKKEKADALALCKAIDEKWREPRERAGEAKKHFLFIADEYITAENKRRHEEAAKINAELEKRAAAERAAAIDAGAAPEEVPVEHVARVEPERVRVGRYSVSQRKVITGRITDPVAFWGYVGAMKELPPQLVEPAQRLVDTWAKAGAQIPGMERVESTRAQ